MDRRNEEALLAQLDAWRGEGKYREMADAVLYLPPQDRSEALMDRLAAAYAGLGEYDKAVHALESLFPQRADDPAFQRRLAEAWLGAAQGRDGEARDDALENAWFCIQRAFLQGLEEPGAEALAARIEAAYGRPFVEEYTAEERALVEAHIARWFGPVATVWREAVSLRVRLDVCVIPPHGEKNYYTLVTAGMGAHRMDVPEEYADRRIARAELAISLPEDWDLNDDRDIWYWPVRQLKSTARFGTNPGVWLSWGDTVECGPVADNTDLSGFLLMAPQGVEDEGFVCPLPDGDEVNFYHLLPLYPEEIRYKQARGAKALLDRLDHVSFVVDPHRWHPLQHRMAYDAEREDILDETEWRLRVIREKGLAVDALAPYSHQAAYLRWGIERGLMSDDFERAHRTVAEAVRRSPETARLREFVRDALGGVLRRSYFNAEGQDFSRYYYEWGRAPYFPSDVDDCALAYFGEEAYHAERFGGEAYLFLPYGEAYEQRLKALIDRRWAAWLRIRAGQRGVPETAGAAARVREENTCILSREAAGGAVRYARRETPCGTDSGWRFLAEPERGSLRDESVVMTLAEALDLCPALVEIWDEPPGARFALGPDGRFRPGPYVPPEDEAPVPPAAASFMEALGCRCEYFPPMADDDRLTAAYGYAWRDGRPEGRYPLFIEADGGLLTHFQTAWERMGGVEACRQVWSAVPVPERRDFFGRLRQGRAPEPGRRAGGRAGNGWACLSEGGWTKPFLLASLPAAHPWELFARLPCGGFGGLPATAALLAAARYWAESWGAVPAVIAAEGVVFRLPAPVPEDEADAAAEELGALCPGFCAGQSAGALARTLATSRVWALSWKRS